MDIDGDRDRSKELSEKLISLVKLHPCLYNKHHKDYHNKFVSDKAWKAIANKLNLGSMRLAKMKWRNIKDSYSKFKKNSKVRSEKKALPYVNYIWARHLSFLDEGDQGDGELEITKCEISSDADSISQDSDNTDEKNVLILSNYENDTAAASNSVDVNMSTYKSNCSLINDPLESAEIHKRRAIRDDEQNVMHKILDYFCDMNKKDSIDLLFESYAKSLKQMRPATQTSVKIQIAQIFAEAEQHECN